MLNFMTTFLLVIILLLLIAIIVMIVTGWPGRERAGIEQAVSELRREMAEYRGDSIRLMQAIRTEVEDAVEESLARNMPPVRQSPAVARRLADTKGRNGAEQHETRQARRQQVPAEQLALFADDGGGKESSKPVKQPSDDCPEGTGSGDSASEEMERIDVIIDDIPDIDDIQDLK
ncbi:hypothetical protein CR163_007275 [Prosthecochloris sp. ZM_2]|nr:hypothetical protein CR163_007275 [Prosthecochloris sp. ZM_2]